MFKISELNALLLLVIHFLGRDTGSDTAKRSDPEPKLKVLLRFLPCVTKGKTGKTCQHGR